MSPDVTNSKESLACQFFYALEAVKITWLGTVHQIETLSSTFAPDCTVKSTFSIFLCCHLQLKVGLEKKTK